MKGNRIVLPASKEAKSPSNSFSSVQSGFIKKNTGIFGESAGIFMYILVLNSQKRYQYFLCSFKTSED